MEIRQSVNSDTEEIEKVHIQAFGADEGPVIAELVNGLFDDKTAFPLLSLVAVENGIIVGHILFTNIIVNGTSEAITAQILAPLAVRPGFQNNGIGGELIKNGLEQLKQFGTDLVFVLGHPGYYPRFGFVPAGVLGLDAPYHIPEKNAGAWMVQELRSGVIGRVKGKVQCSEVLNQPQHWRE